MNDSIEDDLRLDTLDTKVIPNEAMHAAGLSPVGDYVALKLIPITLRKANEYVSKHHRHHKPVVGQKFSIGLSDGSDLRGVVITSRPIARMSDDGFTLEVTRCCTDGVRNGCSMLYRAAWRAAKAMGYLRLITYTLPEEGGASLRGSGFRLIGERGGGSWDRIKRPRTDKHPTTQKLLWELLTPLNHC